MNTNITAASEALWKVNNIYLNEDHDIDFNDMIEEEKDEECPCGYCCMDCLGLSWRDFM